MNLVDQRPSDAPLPPELVALDFDPFGSGDDLVTERLVALTRLEVALRTDLARAARLASLAEAEYLAADTEDERRVWRERIRLADATAISAAHELERVLASRTWAIHTLGRVLPDHSR